MNTLKTTAMLLAATTIAYAVPAKANMTDGLYLSGKIGATLTTDSNWDDGTDTGGIDFDPTTNFNVALGKNINNNTRAELELSYRSADMDGFTIDGTGSVAINGDVDTMAAMINGYYDFNTDRKITPYIMGGVGVARHSGTLSAGAVTADANDTTFAYQAGTGINYNLKENTAVTLGYNYLGTTDPDFDGFESDYGSHEIKVGFMYSF